MIRIKNIALIATLSLLALAGCPGDGGSGHAVNSAYNLTESDFSVSATRTLPYYQFEYDLNSERFFTGVSEDADSSSENDPCIESKLAGVTYSRAGENTFRASINDIDITDCVPPSSGEWSYELVTMGAYIDALKVKDDNGNLVDLEGMNYLDVSAYIPLQYSFRSYSLNRYRNTSTNEVEEYRYIDATHNVSGLSVPCTFDGILDECRYETVFHRSSSDPSGTNYIDKTVIDTHNLGVVDRAPYYQNGTMTFTFNDWSGAMTYGNDAYTPPTYEATNGVDTVSGTYTPPTAPALPRAFSGVPIIPFPISD